MAVQTVTQNRFPGRIMIGLCGYYDVLLDDGRLVQTVARGKFRKAKMKPLAGDLVVVEQNEERQGTFGCIDEILPRKNAFIRPPVANIDRVIVVLSASVPQADLMLVDRLLVQAVRANVSPVICVSKCDEADEDFLRTIEDDYRVFDRFFTSSETGRGVEEFRACLESGVCAVAGQSGVGKSSLLNAACPDFSLEVGNLSRKVERGKHTTRASMLLPLAGGGFVVDTPGFSLMETELMDPSELKAAYPEFNGMDDFCRFGADCLHAGEPGCAAAQALAPGRAQRYRALLDEARERWKRRY